MQTVEGPKKIFIVNNFQCLRFVYFLFHFGYLKFKENYAFKGFLEANIQSIQQNVLPEFISLFLSPNTRASPTSCQLIRLLLLENLLPIAFKNLIVTLICVTN